MKKTLAISLLLLLLLSLFSGCKKKQEELPVFESRELQLTSPSPGDTIAIFDTDLGVFRAVLYPNLAGKAVENFVTHAKNGYYDGVSFHRVISDFVIQSGDPTGTGSGGDSIWMLPFENEYSEQLHHYRGALAMANASPDQNKSQFYFVQGGVVDDAMVEAIREARYPESVIQAYLEVGGRPTLDFNYTVFGQVYDGLDVVDAIAAVKVGKDNRPLEDVLIKGITIDSYRSPDLPS